MANRSRHLFPYFDLTRATLALAGSAVLLSACAPDQQVTQNRPVLRADDEVGSLMRVAAMTRQSGDLDTAVALYRRAHQLDPRDPQPLIELASMIDEQGGTADAALMWQDALRLAPDNPQILGGYGVTLARLGQPELAQTYLQKATAAAPTGHTWNALGVVRDQGGDARGAQAAYRAGLLLEPSDIRLANNLGLSLALSGQFDEALKRLEGVVVRRDATVRHRQNLALAYALAGQDETAIRLMGFDGDPQKAARNVMRYASLATLPDHASKVAAVSTLRGVQSQDRKASAAVEAAALVRSRQQSSPTQKPQEQDVSDRVTPLVAATRVAPVSPKPAQIAAAPEAPTVAPVPDAPETTPASVPEAAVVAAAEPDAPYTEPVSAAEAEPLVRDAPPVPDATASADPASGDIVAQASSSPQSVAVDEDETGQTEPLAIASVAAEVYRPPFIPAQRPQPAGTVQATETPLVEETRPAEIAAVDATMQADQGAADAVAMAVDEVGAAEADNETPSETPSVSKLMMASVASATTEPVAGSAAPVKSAAGENPAEVASEQSVVDDAADQQATVRDNMTQAVAAATTESDAEYSADEPLEMAIPLSLAGISVPSVEDRMLLAASAYHSGDFSFAASNWQPLADAGVVRAQFHLGALYYEGRGVDKDLARAYMLLRQAETAGFSDARIILALIESKLPEADRARVDAQVAEARH